MWMGLDNIKCKKSVTKVNKLCMIALCEISKIGKFIVDGK